MVSQVDQQRVCALLTEAVTVICKNGLTFNNKFCIEGLLGITLDDRNMFLVNIKESIIKGTSGGNTTNQNKSQSGSKAGVFVGMPNVQSNGGRGAGPVPMQRPSRGMSPAMMQQQQQQMRGRRPGGPQPHVIPAKRPVPPMGPNANMGRGRGGAPIPGPGSGGSMPQEWAALIQLQQQQPGMSPSTRGRSRGTARRGGLNRMQHRVMPGMPGEVKSPPRRISQSGVELESREEVERKAAEQARLRSERLERRRSGGPHETFSTPGTSSKMTEGIGDSESPEKPQETAPPPKTEPPREEDNNSIPDKEPPTMDTDDTAESTGGTTGKHTKEEPTPEADHEMADDTTNEPTSTAASTSKQEATTGGDSSSSKGGAADGQTEAADGTKQEGDGSWLLSNSSWLLGDLESMASNTSWKDSAQSDKSQDTAKGNQDDGDP